MEGPAPRVLVFAPAFEQRATLAAELQRTGFEPVVAEDLSSALSALAKDFLAIGIVEVGDADLAQLSETSSSTRFISAEAFCATPVHQLVQACNGGIPHLEAVDELVQHDDPADQLACSTAWRDAAATIQLGLCQTIASSVTLKQQSTTTAFYRSYIELTSPGYHLEWRIELGASQQSACSLAMHMLGTDDEAAVADLMNELANVFMGTIKNSLGDQAEQFVSGLPSREPPEPDHDIAKYHVRFEMEVLQALLVVDLRLTPMSNAMVAVQDLREGMILAHDVYGPRGNLLVEAGSRLSAHTQTRLAKTLRETTTIEVIP
jgi:hypothetical protein